MTFQKFFDARLGFILFPIILVGMFSYAEARLKRDHLTQKEADMVRDTQQLDKRIEILIKAADRRLLALTDPNSISSQKDVEVWGELKGARSDFLYDLSRILDEAITNIDDVSGRDEKNPLIPKAARKLAEASSRFITHLTPLGDKLAEGTERQLYDRIVEDARAILEAAGKLPPPVKNSKKKDSK
jgi:hypothetical protein